MRRITEWLATMPSTNTRIAVTLACVALTAITYCVLWRAPSGGWEAWLTFLAAMAGIDLAQFAVKRKTDNGTSGQPPRNSTTSMPKVDG